MRSTNEVHDNLLRPKRRWRGGALAFSDETLKPPASATIVLNRLPRMKKSGRSHQKWATPPLDQLDPIETVPVTPALHELVELFARACLQPLQSYYSR